MLLNPQKDKNVFYFTSINNKEAERTSLADTNNFLDLLTTQPNFDYFQTHDPLRLMQKKQAQNTGFSLLGGGGRERGQSPPTSRKLGHSPPPRKICPE